MNRSSNLGDTNITRSPPLPAERAASMQHGPSAFVMERQARATNHRLNSQINEMRGEPVMPPSTPKPD